jgi:5S rRNA maturation endonuclease (ribonuclease M5)
LAGVPLFRNGKQLTAKGSLSYEGQTIRINVSATEIIRMKNRKITDGVLLFEDRDSNGNDLRARDKVSLTPFE